MTKHKSLVGKNFYKLKVIELYSHSADRGHYYKCKCECGNESVVRAFRLRHGKTKSCGCIRRVKPK